MHITQRSRLIIACILTVFGGLLALRGDSTDEGLLLSCCGGLEVEFNKSCEMSAMVNMTTIAVWHPSVDGKEPGIQCKSPCKTLSDHALILDQCVDVDVNECCTDRGVVRSDVTQHYIGQPCSIVPFNGASSVFIFLGGLFLMAFCVILC